MKLTLFHEIMLSYELISMENNLYLCKVSLTKNYLTKLFAKITLSHGGNQALMTICAFLLMFSSVKLVFVD